MNKNRIIHTLSTSRTALILLLATLLNATAAQTARAQNLTINTADDWNTFASNVNGGTNYSGQTVTLGADITVTATVGTESSPFTGTFEGNGNTLTVNINETSTQGTAPFRYISNGAVIRNLTVAGSVTGTTHAAGLVGFSKGGTSESPNTIENCTVSTSVSGGSHNGGVVGHGLTSYLKIKNTVFSGSIANGSSYMGGLQGWSDGNHLTIDNCIFKGSCSGSGSFHPIAIHNSGSTTSATVSGAYYTAAPTLTDAAMIAATGTQVSTSAPSDVVYGSVAAADNQTYYAPVTVSGINNYYLYTGNEIAIDYTVTAADGTSLTKDTHYTGTISPATVKDKGNYTLTLTGTGSYSGSQTLNFTVGDGIPVTSETTTMSSGTYKVTENVTIGSRITISGDVKLILGEGTTLTASKGIELSNDNKLTIEGNGTLTATGENEISGIGASKVGTLVINSGTINATGGSKGAGIGGSIHNESGGTITINGGVVTAKGGYGAAGIGGGYNNWGGTYGVAGTITITGGQVHATADDMNGQGTGKGIGAGWSSSNYHPEVGSLTLGWTAQTDFIYAQSYSINSIAFAEGKTFFLDGTSTVATKENIGGQKIVPPSGEVAKNLEYATLNGIDQRYLYTGSAITLGYTLIAGGENLTKGTHFTESLTRDGNAVSEVKEKGNYTLTLTGISPYTGSKSVNFSVISEETFGGCAFTFAVDDEGNYFEVDKKEALTALATYVNSGNNANGLRFKQTADFDMQGVGFTPIGKNDDNVFSGTYDGDGYLILNLSCPDNLQNSGMFGKIANGTVKNVNLKDCSFTGSYAGGIAGQMTGGTIDHCAVIGGTVSCAANDYSGGIVGFCRHGTVKDCFAANTVSAYSANINQNGPIVGIADGYTANNYYTVAVSGGNSTGTKISGGFVTVGEGVTIGSGVWRTIGRTAQHTYYFGKQNDAITLSNSATGAPLGYQYGYTASAGTLSGTTLTMPDADVTISVNTAALLSDGQQHEVSYMTADGTAGEANAIALDGTEKSLAAGWYFVGTDIAYANLIKPDGNITLILADRKTMTLNGKTTGINGASSNLTIYGQSLDDDAGTLLYDGTWDGIFVNNYEQHSGNVRITTTGTNGIIADVTLRGGTLTISADGNFAYAISAQMHSILGGQLTATATGTDAAGIRATAKSGTAITLGWTNPADRITVSSIGTPNGGTVAVKDGQALTDGSGNIYTGTLTDEQKDALAGKTLQPCLVLNETDGVTPLTALAGQANVPVIFARSGLATNAYSTMCLPFGFEKPSDCTFYEFKGVGWSTANSQWEATISEASTLAAHTPYIFKCSDTEATFIGTIASVPSDISNSLVEVGASEGDDTNWKFKGTYTALDWTSADPTEPTYGFSTYVPEQTIAAGTFVRFVQGASLAPFRARLIYSGSDTHLNARAHSRAAQAEGELPRYIIVRIIGANGSATAIGTLDTATGQLSTDEWYTLGGRRLEAKPNAKGIYIHNGKKVAIK